jgi:hypothetical protein
LLDPSGVVAPTSAGPIDVAASGSYLYVEESLTGTLGEFSVASDGSLPRDRHTCRPSGLLERQRDAGHRRDVAAGQVESGARQAGGHVSFRLRMLKPFETTGRPGWSPRRGAAPAG